MARVLIGLCALVCLSVSYPVQSRDDSEDPISLDEICKNIECPEAVDTTPEGADYGMRTLSSGKWVGTVIDDIGDIDSSTTASFWRLFRFIRGNNEEDLKIEMTVPVIYAWELDQTSTTLIGGTMFFYLPQKHQENPPQPKDAKVFIKEFPEMDLYYRAFGGNDRSDEKYTEEFTALEMAVGADGHIMDSHYVFTAGFTRPYWGRQRQEVLFADKSTPFN